MFAGTSPVAIKKYNYLNCSQRRNARGGGEDTKPKTQANHLCLNFGVNRILFHYFSYFLICICPEVIGWTLAIP